MSTKSPVVILEDAIGSQLLLAKFGAGPKPLVARRYEILELRGRGASGLVCRARDTKLHRTVALKLYPPIEDVVIERETLREAQALARLEHPNVVRIHDHDRGVVEAGDARMQCLFVSMEFIEGRPLRAWLSASKHSTNQILRALIAAGDGLVAAHRAGLIHRDFKPENVMVDTDDQVRVVDFGLARGEGIDPSDATQPIGGASAPNMVSTRITRAGVAPGTPDYMAPEALGGHASVSSDQYSFAVTAWEALTGYHPLDPRSDDPAGSRLPSRVSSALNRALRVDPAQRYDELSELLSELRRATRRGRRWAIGVSAVLAALGSIGGVFAVQANTREQVAAAAASRDEPAPDPSRCDEIAGLWMYDNVVVWANDSVRWHGATGHYELELEQLEGCSMNATLRKTGDGPRRYADNLVRHGGRGVRVEQTNRGLEFSAQFQIASDKHGKLTYDFNYVFADGVLSGDYQYTGAAGVVWTGILRGARTEPSSELVPDSRQASCTSQCRIRCPSEATREGCIRTRCISEQVDVLECGRPEVGTTIPPLTLELARTPVRDIRGDRTGDKARKWCSKGAEGIRGAWRLSSSSWTHDIEVEVSDCDLDITDLGASPHRRLRGMTTSTGAWVIYEPGSDEVEWALVGWDPAFGVTHAGSPLAAHRLYDL